MFRAVPVRGGRGDGVAVRVRVLCFEFRVAVGSDECAVRGDGGRTALACRLRPPQSHTRQTHHPLLPAHHSLLSMLLRPLLVSFSFLLLLTMFTRSGYNRKTFPVIKMKMLVKSLLRCLQKKLSQKNSSKLFPAHFCEVILLSSPAPPSSVYFFCKAVLSIKMLTVLSWFR